MRTRTRGTGATPRTTSGTYVPLGGSSFSLGTAEFDFAASGEIILDDPNRKWVRTKHGGSRLMFKPCRHIQHTAVLPSVGCMRPNVRDWVYLTPMLWPAATYPIHPITGRKWNFSEYVLSKVDTSPAKSCFYDHWTSAKPSLETRTNLSVFMAELRDIKRMFAVIPQKHFLTSDWRNVLKYANDQHLNYNFGWKPFISDIRRTFGALQSFEARLANFMANQSKTLLRTRSTESSLSGSKTQDTAYPIIEIQDSFWKWFYQYTGTVTQKSGFQFSYEVPQYSPRELKVRAMLDSLGLNVNRSTIWQVIPWSFVVDWFYDVEGLLSADEEDWVAPYVYWDQSYTSTKIESEGEWWLENSLGAMRPGITWSAKHYYRSVGVTPEFSGTTDSFSADKIRLGSSLILGRLL